MPSTLYGGVVNSIPTLRYTDRGPVLTFTIQAPTPLNAAAWSLSFQSPQAESLAHRIQPTVEITFRVLSSSSPIIHRITHLTVVDSSSSHNAAVA